MIDFTQPLKYVELFTDATERDPGLSSGAFQYLENKASPCHVLFANLVPQPNGACFVSARFPIEASMTNDAQLVLDYENLNERDMQAQWVIDTAESKEASFSYVYSLLIKPGRSESVIPLNQFSASRRGTKVLDAPSFNAQTIVAMGIRLVGRQNDGSQQQGLFGVKLFGLRQAN